MKDKAINILRNMISSWGEADDPDQRSEAVIVEKYLPVIEEALIRVDTLILSHSFKGLSPDVQVIPEDRAWESVTAMCKDNGYPYDVESFSELSDYRTWVRKENDGREDVYTFSVIPSLSNKEYTREVALICCLLERNEVFNGTPFRTFDKMYEVAEKFIEKYPLDIVWGVDVGMEYEETVLEFANNYKFEK